ncbi:MAG: response regulator [Bacteroidia bacterium]
METRGLNLFIVDDNKLVSFSLQSYLKDRFGSDLSIVCFHSGEACLLKIKEDTHIVILDYYMDGQNGLETLKSIKDINPKTEVIMLSANEDMALAVETFRAGAKDYIVKGIGSKKKITSLVYQIITAPVRLMVREFGVSKYLAVFICTFITIGAVVVIMNLVTR